MLTLNKSERIIANAESVKRALLKLLCDTSDSETIKTTTEQIPKLNAIIEIMER